MPNVNSIFLAKLCMFFLAFMQIIHCQADDMDLKIADSLFSVRSYKEAMVIYEQNFQEGIYSPSMLLKMSFITEGIGDSEQATLYLSKYYDLNPNPQTITKIKDLTGQDTLIGYEVSDVQRFFLFLTEYQVYIVGLLTFFLLLSILIQWFLSKKEDKAQNFWPSLILILLIFFANNFLNGPRTGLVTSSPTYIVSKPTAGGELIDQVEPGHRVRIRSSKDNWYEVDWKEKRVFIKKNNVTRL